MSRSLTLITIALTLTAATAAQAQDKSASAFVGPAIGVSVSSVQTNFSYNGNSNDLGNKSASSTGLSASWGFALTPSWVLTAELAYNPDDVQLAQQSGLNTSLFPPKNQTLSLKTKNNTSLSVQPGYRIGGNQLIYAKLGYHTMDVEGSSSLYTTTSRQSIEAPGYGVGYAFAITPHIQLQGEYESIVYSRSGLTKADQDNFRLGVSYRF